MPYAARFQFSAVMCLKTRLYYEEKKVKKDLKIYLFNGRIIVTLTKVFLVLKIGGANE